MTKKTKVIVASILVIILIVGCIIFFPKKSDRLTVTDIHDNVVLGKTTKKDLEERYGKPVKISSNVKKINDSYEKWNSTEGEVSYPIEQDTDYWETLKFDKKAPKMRHYKDKYDLCFEYRSKALGINYIRFLFWKNKVYSIQFGDEVTNESAAKRDKYLKQIYGD